MSSSCSVCRRDECPLPPRGGLRRLPCAERNPDLTGGSHIVPMTLYRDPTLCRAIFFFSVPVPFALYRLVAPESPFLIR